MDREICIISSDEEFAHMLKIELGRRFRRVGVAALADSAKTDLLIVDLDSAAPPDVCDRPTVCFSKFEGRLPTSGEARGLLRPFRASRLIALCESLLNVPAEERQARILGLDRLRRLAIVDGREIPLTDCEFRLFAALLEARGSQMSSDELVSAVWGEEGGRNLLSVYIHYLRKKLEADGRKLIHAHRGGGYSIPDAADAII